MASAYLSMLTPSSTRTLLDELNHLPRRSLGQNFLIDPNIVQKHLALGAVKAGDVIVEVGPGLGTLTRAMLEAGATVYAIEYDRVLAQYLEENVAPYYAGKLHLMRGDAVDHPLAGLPKALQRVPFKVLSNLPYAISTPWLDGVLSGPLPELMVLMLQKEAGERFISEAGSKSFGAISIYVQAAFEAGQIHNVSSKCFFPEPGVDSVLLKLALKKEPYRFDPRTKRIITRLFTQRRKQVAGLIRKEPPLGALDDWMEEFSAAGFSPKLRPEAIEVDLWKKLDVHVRNY